MLTNKTKKDIIDYEEFDELPISMLMFEQFETDLHFLYVNDVFCKTFNIVNNIYADKLYKKLLVFLKDNLIKLDRQSLLTEEFIHKTNYGIFNSIQAKFKKRIINEKTYIFVYVFSMNANFMNNCNVANIMINFNQPSILLNHLEEIISINDAVYELLKLPKSENYTTINTHFQKLKFFENPKIVDFINNDQANQKFFEAVNMKNSDNEDVFANFTIIKIKSYEDEIDFLIIFDETVKNIISTNAIKQLEQMAYYDHLCNVYNRRYFLNTVTSKVHTDNSHCILIMDIDFFKSVNDTYGHLTGDEVIKVVSGISDSIICNVGGLFARYGGEEFIGYIPGKTKEECFEIAEMIRQEIEYTTVYSEGNSVKATLSLGLAYSERNTNDLDIMIKFADSALYLAKNSGRNNCKVSTL